ncbi:MAG: lipoyl(octanoyl) transferase LipB [Actinobacteria bacterium]|nr:lipoyl(octanoyl) transferase LipB [Actinomycetota bacterium]
MIGEEHPVMRPGRLTAAWLGSVDYATAWAAQGELFEARRSGTAGDCLMLLEHPHTYTLGRRTRPEDVIYDAAERAARSIATFEVDRGGRSTYHGPGQLVGYPIIELEDRYDAIGYLRRLEEVVIRTANDLGVEAHRDRATGVWVGARKLAAIGVKVTRGVTMHGFALNVTTDLEMFRGIVPCGLEGRWVTSIEQETGRAHSTREVAGIAAKHFGAVFNRVVAWTDGRELAPCLSAAGVVEPSLS